MSAMDFSAIPVFQGLNPAELGKVEAIFHEETRSAGSVVVTEGQTGEEMYILVRGRVQISKAMLMAGMSVPACRNEEGPPPFDGSGPFCWSRRGSSIPGRARSGWAC